MGKCSVILLCLSGLVGGVFAAVPQVEVTKEVNGNCDVQAKDGANMTVNYEGSFKNGTIFDSSFRVDSPLSFVLGDPSLVKGWNMGLQDACVGDELRVMIPYSLGYGDEGSMPFIPPRTDLYFRIHVLAIDGFEVANPTGKLQDGNNTDNTNGTRLGDNSTRDTDDEYDDDDDYYPEGKPKPFDMSDLLYKLQFLAIPVAVILFLLVAYCIYTIEYPDRKIKFYRVRDHDFDSTHNRVI